MPSGLKNTLELQSSGSLSILKLLFLLVLIVVVTAAVVFFERALRKVLVNYAKRQVGNKVYGGQSSHLPLKLNMAGVIPPIFASSLMIFPPILFEQVYNLVAAKFGSTAAGSVVARFFVQNFGNGAFLFIVAEIALIYFFSYFWTSLMFNPAEMSKNMKEGGSFIPGIRPGRHTADFLQNVMVHMTLAGATFLSVIAIVPGWLARQADANGQIAAFLGGTSILIVVSVALDLVDKLNGHLLMRQYDGFMGGEGSGGKKG